MFGVFLQAAFLFQRGYHLRGRAHRLEPVPAHDGRKVSRGDVAQPAQTRRQCVVRGIQVQCVAVTFQQSAGLAGQQEVKLYLQIEPSQRGLVQVVHQVG